MPDDSEGLWQFPCDFAFKAMTVAIEGIENNIVSAIQKHVPGNYSVKLKQSRGGKYLSVTVNIQISSKQQLDKIYQEVHGIDGVKMLL
jgi:putative lipoic acid-binding regulatory protein